MKKSIDVLDIIFLLGAVIAFIGGFFLIPLPYLAVIAGAFMMVFGFFGAKGGD